MTDGSLAVVGTGLLAAAQATPEAVALARGAEKLLHLVVEPVSRTWLQSLNPAAESLFDSYSDGRPRRDSYEEMVERILAPVRRGLQVCAAFYGHPGVLVQPGHEAVRRARSEGRQARMFPGVSSEDCLFADLEVDPAARGCQSFEATDFLVRRRRFDPAAALVLWQIGAIGVTTYRRETLWSRQGLGLLAQALAERYPPGHEAVVYEAAQFVVCEPSIDAVPIERLADAWVTTSSTLYVPPAGDPAPRAPASAPVGRSDRRGRLTLVGTGYRVAGHVGLESRCAIESADRVFYLVNEPATGAWLRSLRPDATPLHRCYREGGPGRAAAARMVEQILGSLREGREVCAVFSGHPAAGLSVSHEAARRTRREGYGARMLPSVSFEDCLFADAPLDPGADGRCLFEANDFLRRRPAYDVRSALLLLQPGAVGETVYRAADGPNRAGLRRLSRLLQRLYPAAHEAVVYEASELPTEDPLLERVPLDRLGDAPVTVRSTLWVPPCQPASRDPEIAERLENAALRAG